MIGSGHDIVRAPPLLGLDPELAKGQTVATEPLLVWRHGVQSNLSSGTRPGVGSLASDDSRVKGIAMTSHESMKTLISGLNITRYRGLLKTALDETERQTTQTLLREEEIWLKQHTLKG